MPNCKFCGKPVISARVMHAHCWEQKVMELMEIGRASCRERV